MQSLYGAIANTNKKEIMAISVDKVYQKVLAVANKEQRGYITPQEFNLFADHAQMDIFEQYFYDLEQRQRTTGNELDYGDIISNIEEKISMFAEFDNSLGNSQNGVFEVSTNIPNIYILSSVKIKYQTEAQYRMVDKVQLNEVIKYENSPLAAPTKSNPVYTKFSTSSIPIKIKIYPFPDNGDSVFANSVRKPKRPNWTYIISGNSNALYNASDSSRQDFQLHASEENNLVVKILQLAGVTIKDFNLVQIAAQEEMKNIQQEKQ